MHSHKCAEDEFGRRRRREVGEEEGEEKDEGDFHNHKQQRGPGWGQSRGRWGTAPTEGQDSNVRRPGVENHQNQNPYIPTPHDFGSPGPMAVSTPIVFNKFCTVFIKAKYNTVLQIINLCNLIFLLSKNSILYATNCN